MFKAVTLDPGGTTGYCYSVLEDPNTVYLAYGEKRLTLRNVWDGLLTLSPDHLICEDFEYRNRARAGLDLTPVKIIGVVELWAAPSQIAFGGQTRSEDVYFQKASQGKGHFTDDKLKELGIYKKGTNHGRDACRHFMHWLQFGPGFKYIQDTEPVLSVVDETWLLGAYWEHRLPW